MLSASSAYGWSPLVVHVAELAFDRLIRRPVHGLIELASGAAQVGQTLVHAARRAVAEIISAHLSPVDEQAIEQGIGQMKAGLGLLAWPLVIVTSVLFWRAPFLVQALVAVAMLGLPLA